ncbi:MAG: DedA family protein [Candidatus Neomarinimicrobiota bacterium]
MEAVLQFIAKQSFWYVYLILFVFIFLENTLPILPSDTILIFSAYLAGKGALNPYAAYFVTVIGGLAGFVLVYSIGHHWGREYFERKQFKFFPAHRMKKADHYFHKFGNWVLAIGRLIPGIRLMTAMIAGFTWIPFFKAFLFTFSGIAVWNGIIYKLARLLGENWEEIKTALSKYNAVLGILLLLLLTIFIAYRVKRRNKKKENSEID